MAVNNVSNVIINNAVDKWGLRSITSKSYYIYANTAFSKGKFSDLL